MRDYLAKASLIIFIYIIVTVIFKVLEHYHIVPIQR